MSDWSSDVCSSDLLRRQESWRDGMCAAAAAALAEPPPIDLTLKDTYATAEMAVRLGGASLASGHVRVRSEERSVGNECGRTCRSRCQPYHYKNKLKYKQLHRQSQMYTNKIN